MDMEVVLEKNKQIIVIIFSSFLPGLFRRKSLCAAPIKE